MNVHGRRNRFLTVLTTSFLVFVLIIFGYLAQYQFVAAPIPKPEAFVRDTSVAVAWPEQGLSAIGAVGTGLLDNSGPSDTAVPIASITKLFTALAVLEKKPLATGQAGETITISPADEAAFHAYMAQSGSVIPVQAGQQFSQYQLFQAILIPSANNAADTLAIWAFGSMDAYLAYANTMVKRLGLEDTVLTDASGFSPASVSSTKDLVKTAEIVLKKPVLAEIIRQPNAVVHGITIESTNKLLGQNNIIGGKTGNTDQAGDCFLFIAEYAPDPKDKVTIIGVLLGQASRPTTFARAQTLLQSAQKGFGTIEIAKTGLVVGQYQTAWNEQVDIVADQDLSTFGWLGSETKPTFKLKEATGGSPAGQKVGSISFNENGKTLTTSASLKTPLTKPSILWRFTHIRRFF